MTPMTDAPPLPAAVQDDAVLWQHRAFCSLALPDQAPESAAWSREAGGVAIAMGADAAGAQPALPAGPALRLLLLRLFTSALRGTSASAAIGPDPASAAAALGLDPESADLGALGEQAERLASAKLRVTAGKTALSVLDARRSGSKGSGTAWRPVLHLTERFFAGLARDAVPLRRDVVAALAGSAQQLDAYAWLAATLPGTDAGTPVPVSWAELQQRFAPNPAGDAAAFRTAFTGSLEAVRRAWTEARFTIGQDGVELQGIGPAATPDQAPDRQAAPVQAPDLPDLPPVPQPQATEDSVPYREQVVAIAPPPPPPEPPAAMPAPEPVPRPGPAGSGRDQPRRGGDRMPERERAGGRIRLAPGLTGLELSVWLRRSDGAQDATIEVTPGADYNPARRSLFILEPLILQVEGSLRPRELDRVAAWVAANADLIQDYWNDDVTSFQDVTGRVKPVPTQRW